MPYMSPPSASANLEFFTYYKRWYRLAHTRVHCVINGNQYVNATYELKKINGIII